MVADLDGNLVQRTNYYPFGMPTNYGLGEEVQPYKYGGKEFEPMHGINLYDFHARQYNSVLGSFDTMDPLAEKKLWISPYVYCRNNPLRFIDPDGREEYEYDKDGNSVTMTGGREIFNGGEKRDENVDYVTITNEFTEGYGPERSVFEGEHPTNDAVQAMDSYQEKKRVFDATNPNQSKEAYRAKWGITDALTTPNWQAQMMGTYNLSFYRLGNKTLGLAIDSKSKESAFYRLPVKNVSRSAAGADKSFTTTHQVYIFWTK